MPHDEQQLQPTSCPHAWALEGTVGLSHSHSLWWTLVGVITCQSYLLQQISPGEKSFYSNCFAYIHIAKTQSSSGVIPPDFTTADNLLKNV